MSGLAAAAALDEAGIDVLLLEARDRIGGRVHTLRVPGLAAPIELGPEFVHGSAPEVEELARKAGTATIQADGVRYRSYGGGLAPEREFWQDIDRVMSRLPKAPKPDRSLQDFLDDKPGGASLAHARRTVAQFVEGFHAADLDRISAQALATGGNPATDPRETRIGRVEAGYGALAEWLAAPLSSRTRLGAIVERLEWDDGSVAAAVRAAAPAGQTTVEARAAIVTVPVSTLHQPESLGGLSFDPPLRSKRDAIARIAMGCVVHVSLRLSERFWQTPAFAKRVRRGAEDLDRASFVLGGDEAVPVWWTMYPLRVPLVVGWAGGPRAERLAGRPKSEIEEAAIRSMASVFGITARRAHGYVEGAWTHDWSVDPFARGAYSYPLVGGAGASKVLSRPVLNSLFFAGEATEPEESSGTVHGAIRSGRRAARQVLGAIGA